MPFATTAEAVDCPFVAQAARLTRCCDSDQRPAAKIDTEYLLCSRPDAALSVMALLAADRGHWGIETGLHLLLDVSAGEDRSRVRHRTSALKPGHPAAGGGQHRGPLDQAMPQPSPGHPARLF